MESAEKKPKPKQEKKVKFVKKENVKVRLDRPVSLLFLLTGVTVFGIGSPLKDVLPSDLHFNGF